MMDTRDITADRYTKWIHNILVFIRDEMEMQKSGIKGRYR